MTVINGLPLGCKSSLHCLLCYDGGGPIQHLSFIPSVVLEGGSYPDRSYQASRAPQEEVYRGKSKEEKEEKKG